MEKSPVRKPIRLNKFDYSQNGAYFITLCTKERKKLFWDNVGASIARPQEIELSRYGEIVKRAIINIPKIYPAVSLDNYVIMPDHIHLLLRIDDNQNGRPMVAPTVSTIIQQTKGYITKQIGFSVWQKLFHDHIIRNKNDYMEIWEYIENNSAKWIKEKFYEE